LALQVRGQVIFSRRHKHAKDAKWLKKGIKTDEPLPSLEEQRRIVAYLDRLQAKVEELRRLQEQTNIYELEVVAL